MHSKSSLRLAILASSAMLGVACASVDQGGGDANAGGLVATGGSGSGGSGSQVPASGASASGGTMLGGAPWTAGTPATGGHGTDSSTFNGGSGGNSPAIGGSANGGRLTAPGGSASGGRVTATGGTATGGITTANGTGSGGAATGGTATGSVSGGGFSSGGFAIGGGGGRTDGTATGGVASGGRTGTVVTGGAAAVRLAWTNPLVSKRADPHVYLHSDGYYYLTATVPEYDRIELRRSSTLGGLSTAQGKVLWRKHASGAMGAHIWAPEIHFIDGAWHIYFTAGRTEDVWAIRMYALRNASANPLEGEWTELGQIVTNWDSFSLDATTFSHAGQRYYLWTQRVPDYAGTSVLISRMSSPTKLSGAQVVLTWPEYDWEKQGYEVNEAPAVLVKNGKVFITYSASATDHNYCMGLLTADATADLLDRKSWKKASQPVLQSSSQNRQYGPGHNSFTTTPDGRIDIVVYHARNYRDIVGDPLNNPDRATRAQHLPFDAAGLPVFGAPVADGAYQVDVLP